MALLVFAVVGFTLLGLTAYRAGDLPRTAVGIVLAGPAIAAAILAATELLGGDAGEYMILSVLPVIVGWVWINASLAREPISPPPRETVVSST